MKQTAKICPFWSSKMESYTYLNLSFVGIVPWSKKAQLLSGKGVINDLRALVLDACNFCKI